MIAFASRTGNIRYIIDKLDDSISTVEIKDGLVMEKPYFLFTYTDGLGEVPSKVLAFLNSNPKNVQYLKGVIASGNSNFGKQVFCGSANKISLLFSVPIIRKIELRGFHNDIEAIEEAYKKLIVGE